MYTGECKYWVWLRRIRWKPDQKDRANHSNVTVLLHCWVWGTGSKKPAEARPVCEFTSGPSSWVGWWKNSWRYLHYFIRGYAFTSKKQPSKRKQTRSRDSREQIWEQITTQNQQFTQKLNDKPYLFSFILEGISSIPSCQGIKEHTFFYVIWNNIKILAIYIFTFC